MQFINRLLVEAFAKLQDVKNRPFGVPRHGGGEPTRQRTASIACCFWRKATKIIDFSFRWSFACASIASILTGASLQAGVIDNLIASFWGAEEKPDPTLGVLVVHDVPGAVLEVKGKYKIFDPHTQGFISTRYIGKRKFVQPLSDGIKWGEEFPSVHQIQIVPDDPKTTTLVDGIEYKGTITVYDIGGAISVVNHVPLDEYVKSVLNPSSSSLPKELAAALVIVERTDVWNQLQRSASRYFDIDKERSNYRGYAASIRGEDFSTAIADTKKMILMKNGEPLSINRSDNGSLGRLSMEQAMELAQKGDHAAQILNQAFPGSSVGLIKKY